ncbi:exodeoxyribonuclease VII large subunit [Puniceicoccaceae bacterium K14]|nr:exodeoxyribonuclease VII large subunit [Puniceicoccaceae bacterium K14]
MNQFDLAFEDETLTVSQYTSRIKGMLENGIPPSWVKGEISNLRRQASGHIYFSIKDANSQLPAVMFRANASRLGFEVDNGMEVTAFGEISVYEPHGRYQFLVRTMEESGAGRLHREFELLKNKLKREGLFEVSRKQALPELPLRIGFVTSPTGAAIQDFIRILKRRDWLGHLVVLPAKVQGDGAAKEIVSAIEYADKKLSLDLLVIGRGGGSLEDLWCFNEETVARAVSACKIPTISAVGHEIDFALSDFVADLRAETPSAAAELITSAALGSMERVRSAGESLNDLFVRRTSDLKSELRLLKEQLSRLSPEQRIENLYLKLDDYANRIGTAAVGSFNESLRRYSRLENEFSRLRPDLSLGILRQALSNRKDRLENGYAQALEKQSVKLETLSARLEVLHPHATLKRGYAMLSDEKDGLVMSKKQIVPGSRLKARLQDGEVWLKAQDS